EQAAALREQGVALAELDRFWEALRLWDEALALAPADAELHEMRAQALLRQHELQPALEAAACAVRLRPRWWPAQQTLGRALLGLGELGLARRAFSVAMRLQPDTELWREDLLWSCRLLERARRRRAQGGEMSDAGGVVSPAQTDEVRALLGLDERVAAAVARCHADWTPLAEDRAEEEEERARAEEGSDESDVDMGAGDPQPRGRA
ncbi:tetratricopeptide repeat protein 33-like, partial [Pollicipes pollicipes]|uniref:tetratricopeptide repeat protein 33-like n=1 Tax=Pollicipes pollicipes TaxID=41117 RepID=UPI0018859ADA